jgi:hypothetical protein
MNAIAQAFRFTMLAAITPIIVTGPSILKNEQELRAQVEKLYLTL